MNIFKFLKKFFKKNNVITKNKKFLKNFENEKKYNQFYSSYAWKNYQQKEEMDIFLHRNKNKEILTTPLERIERIKTIMEGFLSGEINFNSEEWYEKNKYKLWKYANRKRLNKH